MEVREEILRLIQPHEVSGVWDQVLPGLKKLLRKCPDDFRAEDVYWYLRENKASLFLIGDGFMVVEIGTDVFRGRRTLYVWLLYWLEAEKNQDWIYKQLDEIAKKANCVRIQFKSPRMGWMKKARGFKLKLITWERV